jgi:hypothetical protein
MPSAFRRHASQSQFPGSNACFELTQAIDFIGAARGIRTPDPLITNEVLYQLSYCGISMS